MATAEPRYTQPRPSYPPQSSRVSRVQVDRRKTDELSVTDVLGTAVRVTRSAQQMRKGRQPSRPLRRNAISYIDDFEDIGENYLELADDAPKKSGALRTGVHYLLEIIARVKATRAVWFISFFAVHAIILQLGLGLISLFTLGVVEALDAASATVENAAATALINAPSGIGVAAVMVDAASGGAVSNAAGVVASEVADKAGSAGAEIQRLTGIDVGTMFDVINPMTWFQITHQITFIVSAGLIFVTGVIFMMCGIKPLGGRGATPKYMAFCLGMVGSAFPVLNLFPWFALYAAVVWFHPR
jgi:hypothetical protein